MDKLDRLDWAAGVAVRAFGVSVGIRSTDAAVLEELAQRLPFGSVRTDAEPADWLYSVVRGRERRGGVKQFNLLYLDAARIVRSLDFADVPETLRSSARLLVAEFSREEIFVHAGSVVWKGRAIVIPGRTESGKSTLVKAFLDAGAGYLSDEFALLGRSGRVRAFPESMSLNGQSIDVPAASGKSFPVGLILDTQYRAGSRWRPRAISAGQSFLAMMQNTVPARHRPRASMTRLSRAVVNAKALRGVRGEAEEVVRRILSGDLW
jgi:hypothetical protein